MPAWTIISPYEKDYARHPMRRSIFQLMKSAYSLLDPPNVPSTIGEGKHIAILEYELSQEKPGHPDPSSLVIHFRLSTQSATHIAVMFCDKQIEDKMQNVRISIPSEVTWATTDIYEFVVARSNFPAGLNSVDECDIARRVWKQVQAECYHKHLLELGGHTGLQPGDSLCSLCYANVLHCDSCQRASCESYECSGYSIFVKRCGRHHKMALCYQCISGQSLLQKYDSCTEYELLGWRTCCNTASRFEPHAICPECSSGGMTCLCQKVWACDFCVASEERNLGVLVLCPRCYRPFCSSCSYIDQCRRCNRVSLCYDCAEETSNVDLEVQQQMPAKLVASCFSCQAKLCDRCMLRPSFCSKCRCLLCPSCKWMCADCRLSERYFEL